MEKMPLGVMLGVGENPVERIKQIQAMGFPTVQMGVPPDDFMSGSKKEELKQALAETGIKVTTVFCGFEGESYADIPTIRRTIGLIPTGTRAQRIAKTKEIADFAADLGVDSISAHIGFVPDDTSDPNYQPVVEAVREICDHCQAKGMQFRLETGQETAEALRRFIEDVDRPNLRVNFDPANMLLYGSGDPIEALEVVGDFVSGVHCKDGKLPTEEGQLGEETPLGQGDVGIEEFVKKLHEIGYDGPLTIEREITGDEQTRDILAARDLLEKIKASLD